MQILPSLRNYISGINKRLVFKIKDGYKLVLQIPETKRLFGNV